MLFRTKRTNKQIALDEAITMKSIEVDPGASEPLMESESLATLEVFGSTAIATVVISELTGERAVRLVNDLLEVCAETPVQHFVFDLQNVTYMDSACIGALVELLTKIQSADGRIAMVNAGQSVAYLFRLTKLDRLFPICRDVMQAIASVERDH